jgi:histidine triad (HIT) family protein
MEECLFCKLARGELPADIVYQDSEVVAFNDINAQAPTHILLIPRPHIATLNDANPGDAEILGTLMLRAADIAKTQVFAEPGYRIVMNCNADAGQTVFHVHLHVLAGRRLDWPPG